ncbi:MAG: hypothetical protein GY854_02185 [Deltaproteobacteria bacterium]|nr:hypothetical protein [Deltaproteobacteria bacterium]
MPSFGSGNPFPLELGGGPSSTEQIYQTLKQAVGIGGAAEDGTIEADWRFSQSRGLRAGFSIDRATNQAWPHLATDYIMVYEEMLLLNPGSLSNEERRRQILDRWTRSIDASAGGVEADLQRIDPLLSTVNVDRDTARTTALGRGFEDETPGDPDACGPAFGGGRKSTEWPNYSTDFVCIVRYNLATGGLTAEAQRRMGRARGLLREVLPSWVDWWNFVGEPGFILDQSLLDAGAFGS